MGPLARLPLHPLLLAAYAVLFVYAANIDEVLPPDLVLPLAVALAGCRGGAAAVRAALPRPARRGALLASAIVVAFAFFGHVGSQLDETVLGRRLQLRPGLAFVVRGRHLRRPRARARPAP